MVKLLRVLWVQSQVCVRVQCRGVKKDFDVVDLGGRGYEVYYSGTLL